MYRLQVKTHFDAAHRLSAYEGKCSREHGHRWEVEVCLQGKELDCRNMLVDFVDVKSAMNAILNEFLDHWQLNETLNEPNPTAEFLAKWFYDKLRPFTMKWGVYLTRTCIWESPECCVKYSPTMDSVGSVPVTGGPNSLF